MLDKIQSQLNIFKFNEILINNINNFILKTRHCWAVVEVHFIGQFRSAALIVLRNHQSSCAHNFFYDW